MNISSETGAFKIDGGGGVLTKNFYGGRDSSTGAISGPFRIDMGANAVFVVSETAQFESGRGDDEGFGIFGVSSDAPAVFQAKDIVRDATLQAQRSHGAVTYGGNLYVSAETHFAQGNDGSKPFIYVKDGFSLENNIYAAGFKSGKPNITIPETPCSPGFKGGDPLYRVIAEDLSASEAGDFDFNDVVFDVVKAEGGSEVQIRLRVQRSTVYSARMSLTRMVSIRCITQVLVLIKTLLNSPSRANTRRQSRLRTSSSRFRRTTHGGSLQPPEAKPLVRFWSMTRSCLLRRDRTSLTRMVISPTTYKASSWMTSGGSNP